MKTYEVKPELGTEIIFHYDDSFHIGYVVSFNGSDNPRKWTWFSEINNFEIIEEFIENWFELPILQPERSKREDLMEMTVCPEANELTKMRLEQDVEFNKHCSGINSDLLGCGALNTMET